MNWLTGDKVQKRADPVTAGAVDGSVQKRADSLTASALHLCLHRVRGDRSPNSGRYGSSIAVIAGRAGGPGGGIMRDQAGPGRRIAGGRIIVDIAAVAIEGCLGRLGGVGGFLIEAQLGEPFVKGDFARPFDDNFVERHTKKTTSCRSESSNISCPEQTCSY